MSSIKVYTSTKCCRLSFEDTITELQFTKIRETGGTLNILQCFHHSTEHSHTYWKKKSYKHSRYKITTGKIRCWCCCCSKMCSSHKCMMVAGMCIWPLPLLLLLLPYAHASIVHMCVYKLFAFRNGTLTCEQCVM